MVFQTFLLWSFWILFAAFIKMVDQLRFLWVSGVVGNQEPRVSLPRWWFVLRWNRLCVCVCGGLSKSEEIPLYESLDLSTTGRKLDEWRANAQWSAIGSSEIRLERFLQGPQADRLPLTVQEEGRQYHILVRTSKKKKPENRGYENTQSLRNIRQRGCVNESNFPTTRK